MSDPTSQLYLTLDLDTEAQARQLIAAVLAAPALGCLRLRAAGTMPDSALAEVVRQVQDAGVATLLDGDVERALALGADGVHCHGRGDLARAVGRLKPKGIVGVGSLPLRDDAMEAGELDIDYVMFGEDDELGSFEERLDRVGWWTEIFQVPCVAVASSLDEVRAFAAAGAEFVDAGALLREGSPDRLGEIVDRLREGAAAFEARLAANG